MSSISNELLYDLFDNKYDCRYYSVLYEKSIITIPHSNACPDILTCPIADMRPITPPDEKERHKKQPKQSERKVYITGDTDLLLKHLFDRAVEDKKNPQIKRGR